MSKRRKIEYKCKCECVIKRKGKEKEMVVRFNQIVTGVEGEAFEPVDYISAELSEWPLTASAEPWQCVYEACTLCHC